MIDLYEYINRYIVTPLYFAKNNDPRLVQLKKLEKNQYLSLTELETQSWIKYSRLLDYAYNNTVYYKEVFDQLSLKPKDIQSFSDLNQLPVLTKDILIDRGDDLISKEYAKSDLIKDSSGGSTGKPTIFYKDAYRNSIRRADQYRHDKWSGWDIGKKYALLWGAPGDNSHYKNLKERIYFRYIERNIILDAFDVSVKKYDEFTRQLESYKPSMILGYANLLYQYALYLKKDMPTHKIRPKGIVSSAETLTSEMREVIEETFHCKVFNRYGSREVGLIASECDRQSGLHINYDNIHLEIVDSHYKPVTVGNAGNILVTDYYNKAMPLIRYELGDVGVMSTKQCECGRKLPLLEKVVGRKSDFFKSRDGVLVHGEYFTHLFYGLEGVKQFQVIQTKVDEVVINIAQSKQADLTIVKSSINSKLGGDINIIVNIVDKIPPSASGKFLFVRSNIK